ncbi:hypothetical protein [Microbispora triticiradicis]|uniref:hypothetical protein n=1 Tax=Microbispora triticiradicis TaxID=2200763 RepID=UPI001AD78CBC|nr:hypothetical protein [Microbispora triticiradicis]MBO4275716.1 hypothetical protein [Microbispora triticiradicis]
MRKLYGWAVIAWLIPGAFASWAWRDSVPWVTFMSWYAIVISHATMWQARRAEDAGRENGDATQ